MEKKNTGLVVLVVILCLLVLGLGSYIVYDKGISNRVKDTDTKNVGDVTNDNEKRLNDFNENNEELLNNINSMGEISNEGILLTGHDVIDLLNKLDGFWNGSDNPFFIGFYYSRDNMSGNLFEYSQRVGDIAVYNIVSIRKKTDNEYIFNLMFSMQTENEVSGGTNAKFSFVTIDISDINNKIIKILDRNYNYSFNYAGKNRENIVK